MFKSYVQPTVVVEGDTQKRRKFIMFTDKITREVQYTTASDKYTR